VAAIGPNSVSESGSPRAGDLVSMRAVFVKAAPAVRRYLFGTCGDWHEAEDLAQEALLKAWRARQSFDGRADLKTWIFTVARNHWRDRLRRRRARPTEQTVDEESVVVASRHNPAAVVQRSELAEAIERAVAALPAEQREALALRESEGLTFTQIGQMLGVPTATVKSRVRYALLKLARELKAFARELES